MNKYEEKLLEVIKLSAREAGEILKKGYQTGRKISFEFKGASDFVTNYDRSSERAIIKRVSSSFPEIGFIGEESGNIRGNGSDYVIIIDPIDGTNNFLHSVPHFSISIAVTRNKELLLGLVYHPLLDEMLWASLGYGAYMNDMPLRIHNARPLSEMLVSTCLPYHAKGDCVTSLHQLTTLMPMVAGIRAPGSAALEIAYTSLERFDAFWSQGAQLDFWDIAAGIIIAREAGCIVTDLSGQSNPTSWGSLLAAHPDRHGELLNLLNS